LAPAHLPCALFNQAIGANVTHVPYRGEGPVLRDPDRWRIDYMCATIQAVRRSPGRAPSEGSL
jgi:tripartite-type tricarboxylate transporter receptor subunit TctC